MLSVTAVKPLNRWDHSFIQPGGVAPVGDVLVNTRLKRSCPEQPVKYVWKNFSQLGSNVVDGNNESMYRVSAGARVFDSSWGERSSFRIAHGWRIEDKRAVDRLVQPMMGDTPQYSWQNKVATAYKTVGDKFLPAPNGYSPQAGSVPRGPQPIRYNVSTVTTTGGNIPGQQPKFGTITNGEFSQGGPV